jgi:Putative transposase
MATDKRAAAPVTETDLHGSGREAPRLPTAFSTSGGTQVLVERGFGRCLRAELSTPERYTHRVAISNRRLIAAYENGVTFRYKDYRIDAPGRYTTMTLDTHEFIGRFLMHVLPKGPHRIRHYGFLANGTRAD